MGDSLIRNARADLDTALRSAGWVPVFVCWGGKTTAWGREQLTLMRDLGLTPSCLVLNLGTNDVKNDAVSASELQSRMTALLVDAREVPGVAAVDLWADTSLAPATMAGIADTVAVYPVAASAAGHGAIVAWSQSARSEPGLIGSDGVHDTARGQQVRARIIAEAVTNTCG